MTSTYPTIRTASYIVYFLFTKHFSLSEKDTIILFTHIVIKEIDCRIISIKSSRECHARQLRRVLNALTKLMKHLLLRCY